MSAAAGVEVIGGAGAVTVGVRAVDRDAVRVDRVRDPRLVAQTEDSGGDQPGAREDRERAPASRSDT